MLNTKFLDDLQHLARVAQQVGVTDTACAYRGHDMTNGSVGTDQCRRCGVNAREAKQDKDGYQAAAELRKMLTPDVVHKLCVAARPRVRKYGDGLSQMRYKILRVMESIGADSATRIGRQANVKNGSIHQTLRRLQDLGFVTVHEKMWCITESGRRAIKRFNRAES